MTTLDPLELLTMDKAPDSRPPGTRVAVRYILPGLLIAYLIAYLLVWLLTEGPTRTTALDLLNIVGPLLAAVFCVFVLRRVGGSQRAHVIFWSLILAAMVSSVAAETSWAVYELALDVSDPFPSVADIFWLLAYPLEFAAATSLVASKGASRVSTVAIAVGAALVALVAGTLMVLFIMLPSVDPEASSLSNVVTILYPAGDVLLLSALGALALLPARKAIRIPRGIFWVFMAFTVSIVADLVYAAQELGGSYATGSWVDLLWPLSYALIGAAAAWQLRAVREHTVEHAVTSS